MSSVGRETKCAQTFIPIGGFRTTIERERREREGVLNNFEMILPSHSKLVFGRKFVLTLSALFNSL